MKAIRTFNVKTYRQSTQSHLDKVAVEEPLEIWLKRYSSASCSETQHLSTTMRTPGHDIELVSGWLHSLNLIQMSDIQSILHTGVETLKQQYSNRIMITLKLGVDVDVSCLQRAQYANSSCGVCGQQSIEWMCDDLVPIDDSARISLSSNTIKQLSAQLGQNQPLFSATGGMHGAALVNQAGIIYSVFEDVGRHNALDKLVGANLQLLPGLFGVVLSGRVSFEMVQKAARAGISMIVAMGAPTSLAIELCQECDITLIGFLQSDRFNVYHGWEYIN
ncbi:formate dehydrogenase accessory sulfurtransferase FdhD [Aliiglaciecola litoralis]|uniref:Sulfur carrier protein FdhD n=1 Tax=Aliiglaciecola litoralis TaxID=582857 RepID=A0ABN1LNC6_9ALTE